MTKTARMERYASDFMRLADTGVALPCYNVTAPVVPLQINTQHSLFKLYLCDVGLLSAQLSNAVRFDLLQGNMEINWGSILENVIAQELVAQGSALHYFDKSKYGEVDFLLESGETVVPVEAKSGSDYAKHPALDNVMGVGEWAIGQAVVLCEGNVEQRGEIAHLPWYAVMYLARDWRID